MPALPDEATETIKAVISLLGEILAPPGQKPATAVAGLIHPEEWSHQAKKCRHHPAIALQYSNPPLRRVMKRLDDRL